MKTLDEQIADIEKLDDLRRQARKLRQEAIDVLSATPYGNGRANWDAADDDVEKAQVLRALTIGDAKKDRDRDRQQASKQALIRDLNSIVYAELIPGGRDNVPILRAAYVLQAFAETPGQVLSPASMACFCRIVQELNQIVDPTWAAGAARAGDKAAATGFVTGECTRALLMLKEALEQTAEAADLLEKFVARMLALAADDDGWSRTEQERQQRSLQVALATHSRAIISISTDAAGHLDGPGLLNSIDRALSGVPTAQTVMGDRPLPPNPAAMNRMREIAAGNFDYVARMIAWDSLDQLQKTLLGLAGFAPGEDTGRVNRLRKGAQLILDLLGQIEPFAESIIDRQITAASRYLSVPVDGAELVFAATVLGQLTDWKRPKIRAAYEVLYPLLSSNGRLLGLRPFDLDSQGYRLNVATVEVTRRLADLIAHLDVEPEPEFVTRLMLPLEYTRVAGNAAENGWTVDPPPREPKSLWWLTAIAAGALDSVVKMLDQTINRRVLRQFHVRRPETLPITLDKAFYPDYGIAGLYWERRRSVAFELLQLCAHAGHGPPEKEPMFSLILYGPPGTGKTTLVEAVAASANVPLVEVTPSDILVGGVEGIERRTRQVFQALSKLTHVVILFDEFEQILLERTDKKGTPTSAIEFITPGMLPKLKALYEASKTGRASYVLATNFLNTIDRAVKRDGRFDRRCGVYPPDVVSRFGRLRDQFRSFAARLGIAFDPACRSRIAKVVERTAGGPMTKLGSPGWFTAPANEENARRKPFGHILDSAMTFDNVAAEAEYSDTKANAESKKRLKPEECYWAPWKKIRAADKAFKAPAGAVTDRSWRELGRKADRSLGSS